MSTPPSTPVPTNASTPIGTESGAALMNELEGQDGPVDECGLALNEDDEDGGLEEYDEMESESESESAPNSPSKEVSTMTEQEMARIENAKQCRHIREQQMHHDCDTFIKNMGNDHYMDVMNRLKKAKENEEARGGKLSRRHALRNELQNM
eukprot:scaffold45555_cov52-Attheya_sp.AAC.2